ncbi:unnamed protein product, partial [Polarella glacialis]
VLVFAEDSRRAVLLNGKVLASGQEASELSHHDRLCLGRALLLRLHVPMQAGVDTIDESEEHCGFMKRPSDQMLVLVDGIQEMLPALPRTPASSSSSSAASAAPAEKHGAFGSTPDFEHLKPFLEHSESLEDLREYVKDVFQKLEAPHSVALFEILREACHLVDEANMITREVRPEDNMSFQVELLWDIFSDPDNCLIIRLFGGVSHADQPQEIIHAWPYSKFRERLDLMRDAYRVHCQAGGGWRGRGELQDPWMEVQLGFFSQQLVAAKIEEKLRAAACRALATLSSGSSFPAAPSASGPMCADGAVHDGSGPSASQLAVAQLSMNFGRSPSRIKARIRSPRTPGAGGGTGSGANISGTSVVSSAGALLEVDPDLPLDVVRTQDPPSLNTTPAPPEPVTMSAATQTEKKRKHRHMHSAYATTSSKAPPTSTCTPVTSTPASTATASSSSSDQATGATSSSGASTAAADYPPVEDIADAARGLSTHGINLLVEAMNRVKHTLSGKHMAEFLQQKIRTLHKVFPAEPGKDAMDWLINGCQEEDKCSSAHVKGIVGVRMPTTVHRVLKLKAWTRLVAMKKAQRDKEKFRGSSGRGEKDDDESSPGKPPKTRSGAASPDRIAPVAPVRQQPQDLLSMDEAPSAKSNGADSLLLSFDDDQPALPTDFSKPVERTALPAHVEFDLTRCEKPPLASAVAAGVAQPRAGSVTTSSGWPSTDSSQDALAAIQALAAQSGISAEQLLLAAQQLQSGGGERVSSLAASSVPASMQALAPSIAASPFGGYPGTFDLAVGSSPGSFLGRPPEIGLEPSVSDPFGFQQPVAQPSSTESPSKPKDSFGDLTGFAL